MQAKAGLKPGEAARLKAEKDGQLSKRGSAKKATASSKPAEPRKACLVCMEEMPLAQLVNATTKCTHSVQVCRPCLRSQIEADMERKGGTTRINCPVEGCKERLEYGMAKATARANGHGHSFIQHGICEKSSRTALITTSKLTR